MRSPRKKKSAEKPSVPMGGQKAATHAPTGAEPALSVEELFDRFPKQIMVLFGWFCLEHLNDLYRAFNGDMVMPIILGEIAHHNVCHYYSKGRQTKDSEDIDRTIATKWDSLETCNALSLSDATGIPRETCRRKVRELCRRGFIQRQPHGGYVINRDISKRFLELNRRAFSRFLVLRKDIDALAPAARR